MDIVIDIGNTRVKIGVYNQDNLVYQQNVFELTRQLIDEIFNTYNKINGAILSSVSKSNKSIIDRIKEKVDIFIELNHNTPIPIKNKYQSPETLGKDRLAAVVGARKIFPEGEILIIDAGTAVTFDFINSNNEYMGGNISPGLEMRFRALNSFSAKLPKLSVKQNYPDWGINTKTAIVSGVQQGLIYEIEGYISKFFAQNKDLKVILTGGDVNFFDKKLKNTIFAEPNLTLIGLHTILHYNEKKD